MMMHDETHTRTHAHTHDDGWSGADDARDGAGRARALHDDVRSEVRGHVYDRHEQRVGHHHVPEGEGERGE